jgi:WD40 repeat protein
MSENDHEDNSRTEPVGDAEAGRRPKQQVLSAQFECPNPACVAYGSSAVGEVGRPPRCPRCGAKLKAVSQQAGATLAHEANRSTYPVAIGVSPPPSCPDEPLPAPVEELPKQIGRFQIRPPLLGAGTFGKVYRAYDPELDREVALKVPQPSTLNSARRIERFLRESKSSASLHHPHIVTVYDAGKDCDQYFIASAFIEGGTLEAAIDQGGIDIRPAVEIVRDLAEALAYAHEMGIIHRDVKPANVMLDEKWQPHLMDFGIAYHQIAVEEDESEAEAALPLRPADREGRLTRAGVAVGTPTYMSPEQWQGRKVSGTSDQYSLGVLLYEMLCGQTPLSGPIQILKFNAINTPPPSPRSVRPSVPLDLEAVCLKTLSKRPEERYPDCQELADDLRRWLEDEPVTARPLGLGEKLVRWGRREPALVGAISVAALAIIAVGVLAIVYGISQAQIADKEANHVRELADANEQINGALGEANDAKQNSDRLLGVVEEERDKLDKLNKEKTGLLKEKSELLEQAIAATREAEEGKKNAQINNYFNLIALAERELRDRHAKRAGQLLDMCPEELRQWEYNLLRRKWEDERDRKPVNDGGNHLAYVSYGTGKAKTVQKLAWVAEDKDLLLVDLDTRPGPPIRIPTGHNQRIWCVAASTVGKTPYVATASADGTAKVWRADTFEQACWPLRHNTKEELRWVALWDRNKGYLEVATASMDRTVKIWDTHGTCVHTYSGHSEGVRWVGYSPDGSRIASVSLDNYVKLRNIAEEKEELNAASATAGAFSRTGRYRALARDDGSVVIYEGKELKQVCVFRGHTDKVYRVAFSDDDRIFSLSEDGLLKVWKIGALGQPLVQLSVVGVTDFDLSPSGNQLFVIDHDKTVKVWEVGYRTCKIAAVYDIKRGTIAKLPKDNTAVTFETYSNYVTCTAISRNGKWLATAAGVGDKDQKDAFVGEVIIWDLNKGQQLKVLKDRVSFVYGMSFGPDDESLALGCKDGKVVVWTIDAEENATSILMKNNNGEANTVAYSRVGNYLACGWKDGTIQIRDMPSGDIVTLRTGNAPVNSVAFCGDSKYLASASDGEKGHKGAMKVWDWKKEELLVTLEPESGDVKSVVCSPDGKYLTWAGSDQKIRIWGLAAGKETWSLGGHTREIMALAFSPDGKRLASASKDMTVKLWDNERGREALSLQGQHEFGFSLIFSPDGKRLVACTPEGIKVWDSTPRKPPD